MRSRASTILLLSGLSILFSSIPVAAHHSFCGVYREDKIETITGTVAKIEWQNPHVWFYLDFKDGKTSKTTRLAVEFGAPHLLAPHLTRDTVKVGDLLTVSGELYRDRTTISSCTSRILDLVSAAQARLNDITSSSNTDFSTFKTFTVGAGTVANAIAPGQHTLSSINAAIREVLTTKKLTATLERPDLTVTFNIEKRSWPRGNAATNQNILTIEIMRRNSEAPVWRAQYSDEGSSAEDFLKKLPEQAGKMLSAYPAKYLP